MMPEAPNYIEASNRTFATSTALSILIHGVVFFSLVLMMEQSASLGEHATKDILLELIGADVDHAQSLQQELNPEQVLIESAGKGKVSARVSALRDEDTEAAPAMTAVEDRLITSDDSDEVVTDTEQTVAVEAVAAMQQSAAIPTMNTHAVDDQLIKLLHSRISDKKQYPYFAKRQRREGVATVSFVLHPNGDIEDTRLVNSSRSDMLDRAAITAVEKIEPFEAAQEYLETAETFNIDVVFELL